MANKARNTSGKFAPKSETPRKVRSVNLTDETWNRLAAVAEKTGKSRNDFLESLLQSDNPFIETVLISHPPFMETAASDVANTPYQPDSEVSPLMETVVVEIGSLADELETVRVENQGLHIELGNCEGEKEALEQELVQVLSQFQVERADRKEIERELSDLKQNSAPASELPEAADLLNQLKAKRKKSSVTLADVEKILEIIEEDGNE